MGGVDHGQIVTQGSIFIRCGFGAPPHRMRREYSRLDHRGGSRKNIWGWRGWPLIIWEAINQSIKVICNARNVVHKLESEATKAKRNYYRTNYVKHVEKLGLNCPEKNFGGGLGKIWGGCAPLGPT